jgi:hypothetical protein
VQLYLNPQAEHLLDWFHLTLRLTVLNHTAKGTAEYPKVQRRQFHCAGQLALMKIFVKSGRVALVLGRWRANKSFIGLRSKFVGEVLLSLGEIELVDQVVFACAALLDFAD